MKYRKITEPIEAIQYTGDNLNEVLTFMGKWYEPPMPKKQYRHKVIIPTSDLRNLSVEPTDWILKTKDGCYVWANEWFCKNYEEVHE